MTGPDPGEGFFDHLDDPGAPVAGPDAMRTAMQRGRHLRSRRRTAMAASSALAVTALLFGGLGISHALQADRHPDEHELLHSPTASATPSVTASARHHRHGGDTTLVPVAPATHPTHHKRPPVSSPTLPPCVPQPTTTPTEAPTSTPSATDSPASSSPTPPPPVQPSPSCPTNTPSPAPSPTTSPTDSPAVLPTP